ncbi:MAG: hypothetical protein A3G52_00575 [Candidatus Taylorbacteria bacterium RIFCSPLOWO2_12_FULL_43_20]|uniref:Uncharacterized protein n=1 Tax=Candidatus Taylorbacteria bacterium RIFCSPLOWO2_12_FULL_43_20 TaxID=1802332 RepID=A0A1G2P0V2_9BACT|nr:MAG: hypothetical protein A2825_00385 [Candidatus Taylorbacteria bacterium RIFCSPHIGHO2_01_FULL_43_120]OHA22742.1 MAG: hypothetical protein A3B98_01050 [Candidatus Taylorbacteria bacterium RIFCSPHIGHO2_02_FULL_43_55]OHA28652.1 MAG: hypothetical protein A3E92_01085 [Candidatus Taylorbacteria bacterium RIFCSPHIGHO2_12_FULL_42_34]OHA38187.1 MAG: hypothetical protein A3H58_04430 [Candidatus Taylorbacteria bacterium RIFCSPLOWO2_02_FULL_43_22b]OHA41948.1 MAG: hypothetical protein A3G52_00575 [Cand
MKIIFNILKTSKKLFLKLTSLLLIIIIFGGVLFAPYRVEKAEAVTAGLVGCVSGILSELGIKNVGSKVTSEVRNFASDRVPVSEKDILEQTTIIADKQTNLENKEFNLDSCVKGIAQEVIHQITSSIIDWINNGFEGSPTFISNPEAFFGDIADQTLGLFIEGAGLDFLCTPFKLDIQFGLRSIYRRDARVYCTPSRIAQVQGFTDKDFKDIGWDGWLELTTRNENNYYGSWVTANNDLNAAMNYRINKQIQELTWGSGFMSIKDEETGEINTPGSIIVRQADRALGSNLEELQLAKEFDDIIYALINQLTNQLITKGLRN